MKVLIIVGAVLGMLTLTSCDKAQESKIENPMTGYTKAIDAAKAIEGQLLQADQNRRKAIEEMTK